MRTLKTWYQEQALKTLTCKLFSGFPETVPRTWPWCPKCLFHGCGYFVYSTWLLVELHFRNPLCSSGNSDCERKEKKNKNKNHMSLQCCRGGVKPCVNTHTHTHTHTHDFASGHWVNSKTPLFPSWISWFLHRFPPAGANVVTSPTEHTLSWLRVSEQTVGTSCLVAASLCKAKQ